MAKRHPPIDGHKNCVSGNAHRTNFFAASPQRRTGIGGASGSD
jgi:hypothetical protein